MTWHRQRPSSPRQTLPIPTASRITILIAFIALLICQVIAQSTVTEVQSYNGYGNNKRNPTWGQAGTPYLRMVRPAYGSNQAPGGSNRPNARLISNQLFSKSPFLYTNKNVTDFLANWGLLLHMDIMVTERNHSEPFHIPVNFPDTFFNPTGAPNVTISMNRSDYIGVNTATNQRLHVNSLSSFIDGSALYGHTNEKAMSMRSFRDGLLKSQNFSTGEFPVKAADGMFLFPLADVNRTPQCLAIYIILLREHQRRARQIKSINPSWSDEQIFQKARRWVIAIIQKITYEQYLPVLIGEPLPHYTSYNDTINPQAEMFFTNVAMRYGHSAITQLVMRYEENGQVSDAGHKLIRNCMFGPNVKDLQAFGVESVVRGMAVQKEQMVDVSVIEDMRDHLVIMGIKQDLPAIDVQRGRDTGIPDYNTCREAFGLPRVLLWSEITPDVDVQGRLRQLYNDDISNVDAIVGAMAEIHEGAGVLGELFVESIKEQFVRLRDGDRFWYENPGILDDDEKTALTRMSLGELVKINSKIITYPSNPFRTTAITYLQPPSAPIGPPSASESSVIEMLGTLRLTWVVRTNDGMVDFLFQSNASGWFGMGIGSNMVNADIYFVTKGSNGSLTVIDSWSFTSGAPQPDTSVSGQNNLQLIQDVTSLHPTTRQSIQFSRRLTTSDPRDADIPNSPIRLIFAFHPTSHEYRYHESNRGVVEVNLFTRGVSISASGMSTVSMSLKILHGFSMFLAFAVIYPIGIFVARYYTDLNKWVEIHATLMTTVTSNVVITAITAIIGKFSDSDRIHVRLGLSVVGLVLTTLLTGYTSSKVTVKVLQPYLKYIRPLHRLLGLITYVMGIITGYFGSGDIQYGDDSKAWIRWGYVGLIGFMPLVLFIYGEFHKRRGGSRLTTTTLQRAKAGNDKLPVFMWEDVNQRVSLGAKWIVIEDTIYDIESFIDKHPGGSALLRNHIGLDATKIFHGNTRRTLERMRSKKKSQVESSALHGPVHKHSRFAKYLLASMAVGRLRKDDEDEHQAQVLSQDGSTKSKSNTLQRPHSIVQTSASVRENEHDALHSLQRQAKPAIFADHFRTYTMSNKTLITAAGAKYPVYHLRFDFDRVDEKFRVKPGQSVLFQFVDEEGKVVTRSYTPLRCDNEGGIDFFIKMYGGEMTKHLLSCRSIRMRGPVHSMDLLNRYGDNGCWKVLGLIAGGTGLSPMLLMIDYHLKYGARDPITNRPTFKIHLLIMNHSDTDIIAASIVEDMEKACDGALTVNYMISTAATQNSSGPGYIVGRLSQEVIMSTMPRPPVDYKIPTWMPSTMAGQGQGQGGGYTNVLSPRKSFTLGPNITDRAIVEAIENGSHSGEIPAMTTTRGPNNAHRPTTREDSNARYSLRDSGGANSMPNAVREESSLRRRSIEDASKIAQGRSRTSTMSQVPGNGGGGGAPMTVQEGEIDWDVYRNMAIVVCGPTMMNIAVGDLLRDMNYPADVIYTL